MRTRFNGGGNLPMVSSLLKFIDKPNEDIQETKYTAMASFLGEGLFPDEFDMDHQEFNLQGFKEAVGDELFNSLYPCALEFFFSNEYPRKDTGKIWNVIDLFLKKRGHLLSNKDYYKSLRDSYMDIYEVIHINPDEILTFRSLLKYNPEEIIVKEKKATHQLARWDIIGARVVKTAEADFLGGGVLILSQEAADEARENIEMITDAMFAHENFEQLKASTPNPELMIRKMWAKEIASYWFHSMAGEREEPELFNRDGDKLQFFTLAYPLATSKAKVARILNNLPELYIHDCGKKHSWVWFCERKGRPFRQGNGPDKGIEFETLILDPETREQRPIFAEIKIRGKQLVVDVNSAQRRNIMEDYINTHLEGLAGKPETIQHDLKSYRDNLGREGSSTEISCEEEKAIMNEFYSQHYQEWPDCPIPALDG
jgi:hypothetical protein